MKKVLVLFLTLIFLTNISHTAEKRILLEQFTGAWCGWCVDGTYMLDSLMKKYPNQVIGVRQHTGDGMSTEQSQTLYSAYGLAGVPTGTINRLDFTGKVPTGENPYLTDRSQWFGFIKTLLAEAPKTDVSCSWYYDEANKQIKGLVSSSLLKELPFQQALNAFIIENKVTGTGKLFDQNNYYAGLKGYEKHPYYKKPAVLVGYQHNLVQRLMVGGKWGEKLNIKKTGLIGETYQWSFCVELPSVPYGDPINPSNVDVIGISAIDETNNSEILNSIKGSKEIPKTSFIYSTNGYTHFVNDKVTINMKIDNLTDINNDYGIGIENIGYGAKNWTVVVNKNTFAVKSGESVSFSIDVTPNSQGMKKFRVVLKDKDNNNFYAFSEITIYNKDTEKFILSDSEGSTYSNLTELDNANYNDFIYLTNYQYDILKDSFTESKLVIMDNSDYSALSDVSPELINTITKEGKKLFIMGNGIGALTKTYAKLLTFWAGMGFKFNEQYTKFDEQVNKTLGISGYKGDPISDGSKITLIPSERSEEYSTFGILDYDIARPVYSVTKDPNSIVAFRTVMNNQRVLVSSMNFFNIQDEDQRFDYINKSIDWLMDGIGEDQAHLSISTNNLNYNLVELGKSDTLDIVVRNYGNTQLQIPSQAIISETSEFSSVTTLGYKSINAGDSITFKIRFTPTSKNQAKGYFYLKTDDPYRDSVAVTLAGRGRTSVEDDLQVRSSIVTSPNPVAQFAKITVTFDNNMQNVSVNLIDLQGRLVKQISNGDFLKGTYSFDLSTDDLGSGSYFVQLANGSSTFSQPIIIEK